MYTVLNIIGADSIQLSRTCHNSGADVVDVAASISIAPNLAVGTNRSYFSSLLSNATSNEVAFKFDYTTNKAAGSAKGLQINATDTAVTGGNSPLSINVGGYNIFDMTSLGAATIYNSTPTSGVTDLIVRAGAGQAGGYIQEWRTAAGANIAAMLPTGAFYAVNVLDAYNGNFGLDSIGLGLHSARFVAWAAGTNYSGAKDIALSRASAGLLQINSGTAGVLRDLELRVIQKGGWGAGTEGGCNTYADLVVDGALNTKVTSASYNFVAADVGGWLDIAAGGAWTAGRYSIVSVAANAATLGSSPAAVGSTAGTFITNRGKIVFTANATADTLHVCGTTATVYGWAAPK
jgi:hypothetical protein